jgi:hypothetical protein
MIVHSPEPDVFGQGNHADTVCPGQLLGKGSTVNLEGQMANAQHKHYTWKIGVLPLVCSLSVTCPKDTDNFVCVHMCILPLI